MKLLSEQLSDLADRVKTAEDFVSAAQTKNRSALEAHRARLKSSIDDGIAQAQADAGAAQNSVQSWWNSTRMSVDGRLAELRAKAEDNRADRNLKRAEARAEDAEDDAAYAIEFAISMLEQAEYAVADAVLARADVDVLAVSNAD